MKVTGFICKKCKVFVYSRSRHDFSGCDCDPDYSYVDGGQDNEFGGGYGRAGGFPENMLWGSIEIDATPFELHHDWNSYDEDEFGNIPVTDEEIELWEGKDRETRPTLRTGAYKTSANQKT